MRLRHGFTLIELLVVVSIVALLIALLLPALNKARDQSRDAQCRSNHRQFAIAYTSYVMEHRELTLRPPSSIAQVYGYLESHYASVWDDPAYDRRAVKGNYSTYHYGYPRVNLSVYARRAGTVTRLPGTDVTNPLNLVPPQLSEFPSPSTTALFFCNTPNGVPGNGGNTGFIGAFDVANNNREYSPWPLHGPRVPNNPIYPYGTRTNVSRLDGSVRQYAWREVNGYAAWLALPYSDVPAHPTVGSGTRVPRGYLWTGHAPGRHAASVAWMFE